MANHGTATALLHGPRPGTELPVLPPPRLDLQAPDVGAGVNAATLIADRSRAAILRLLADGPHCVCEMAAALGERQNNVSNHLARLRDAGLVRTSRYLGDSRRVYYERDEGAVAAAAQALEAILATKGVAIEAPAGRPDRSR